MARLPLMALLILLIGPHAPAAAEGNPFITAMREGHDALSRDDPSAAREAFERALELRPGDAAAADGLAQAEVELRRREIVALGGKARALEAEERYSEAAERYGEVLEIDATVTFAQEGQRRARSRAELLERLAFYLAHPRRLAEAAVLGEARATLDAAREIESPGPRHRQMKDDLAALVASWDAAVTVELRSDAETAVTIYRVGRFGAFTERAVELRPGAYTVVGSRRGYRDVRHDLVIEPGQTPPVLTVICDEKI